MFAALLRLAGVAMTVAILTVDARADILVGVTLDNFVVTLNSASPDVFLSRVAFSGLQVGETVLAIDRRPATGLLYGLGSTSRLYTINPTTGAATQVGSAGAFTLNGTAFGFDFDPVADRIRVTSNSDQNIQINPNNGTLSSTDAPLAFATVNPNVVGSAYNNNFAGASSTTLYGIDSNLDALVTQNPPNAGTLQVVGPLGFDTTNLVGFDISGSSGLAFASLTGPAANASRLYTINLNNGAATFVNDIGIHSPFDAPLVALAAEVGVPEPSSLVLVGIAGLGLICLARRKARH